MQLRTAAAHRWSQTAEALSDPFERSFKSDGTTKVHEILQVSSRASQASERSPTADPEDVKPLPYLSMRSLLCWTKRAVRGGGCGRSDAALSVRLRPGLGRAVRNPRVRGWRGCRARP